jgi:GNAT superfamily N-acetyltransferase
MNWTLRIAREDDIPMLEELIPLSARLLLAPHYSPAQIEAALGPVFGVDRKLIRDGTYFVADQQDRAIGCGGWSMRTSLFGGDKGRKTGDDRPLDPELDAARVRAFFVHPSWARRGIGREILMACEKAILEARFHTVEISATLSGEPLYAAHGYQVVERYEIPMFDGLRLPVVRMTKNLKKGV